MKILFFAVDCQDDFMNPDGKLYVKGAEEIKPYLKVLTDYAKQEKFQVINTADLHTEDSSELSDEPDFKTTFPKHCMEKTAGVNFIKETNPENPYVIHYNDYFVTTKALNSIRNIVLYKDDVDIFKSNPNVEFVIKTIKPDMVVVYGVASNVCVDRAIRGLRNMGLSVLVVIDAIKSLPDTNEEELYKEWKKIGASFTTVREVTDVEIKIPEKKNEPVDEEKKEKEEPKETPKEEKKEKELTEEEYEKLNTLSTKEKDKEEKVTKKFIKDLKEEHPKEQKEEDKE